MRPQALHEAIGQIGEVGQVADGDAGDLVCWLLDPSTAVHWVVWTILSRCGDAIDYETEGH